MKTVSVKRKLIRPVDCSPSDQVTSAKPQLSPVISATFEFSIKLNPFSPRFPFIDRKVRGEKSMALSLIFPPPRKQTPPEKEQTLLLIFMKRAEASGWKREAAKKS
jgi:hypothetical protein